MGRRYSDIERWFNNQRRRDNKRFQRNRKKYRTCPSFIVNKNGLTFRMRGRNLIGPFNVEELENLKRYLTKANKSATWANPVYREHSYRSDKYYLYQIHEDDYVEAIKFLKAYIKNKK